jgi:LacI family transcriptional regulator
MSMVTPGITAVAQDAVAVGRAAVGRLLERIGDRGLPPQTEVVDAQVMARGSMAAPRRS